LQFISVQVWQPMGYWFVSEIFALGLSKVYGRFLVSDSAKHFYILFLDFLDFLLSYNGIKATYVVLRLRFCLAFLSVYALYFLKQQSILPLYFSILSLQHVIFLRVFWVQLVVWNLFIFIVFDFPSSYLIQPFLIIIHYHSYVIVSGNRLKVWQRWQFATHFIILL